MRIPQWHKRRFAAEGRSQSRKPLGVRDGPSKVPGVVPGHETEAVDVSFASRFASVRSDRGPLVWGLDHDVARVFAACPDRVMPSASRSLLAGGPDLSRLRDAGMAQAAEFRDVLTQ